MCISVVWLEFKSYSYDYQVQVLGEKQKFLR